ncbi:MAG: shikimate kinase [Firmicutes bacterium]|nr:shikimate kinase [Bacillota bacterium]
MNDNIVLIGFMGTGKTAVGRRLAKELGKKFIDTDKEVEKATGLTVAQVFAKYGETRFRSEEALVIRKVVEETNCVIAAGGGVVLRRENVELLRSAGVVICLTADPAVIHERVKRRNNRPLLKKDKSLKRIEELLRERNGLYQVADYYLDTTHASVEELVQQIIDYLRQGGGQNDQSTP